jgi:ribosome-binding protein aMBF1 (putative translation factor)
MTLAERISGNIANARRQAGLSQADLGFRLHAASQEISRLESGRFCPRLTTLQRVARALEVPLMDLLDGIE